MVKQIDNIRLYSSVCINTHLLSLIKTINKNVFAST